MYWFLKVLISVLFKKGRIKSSTSRWHAAKKAEEARNAVVGDAQTAQANITADIERAYERGKEAGQILAVIPLDDTGKAKVKAYMEEVEIDDMLEIYHHAFVSRKCRKCK